MSHENVYNEFLGGGHMEKNDVNIHMNKFSLILSDICSDGTTSLRETRLRVSTCQPTADGWSYGPPQEAHLQETRVFQHRGGREN